MGQYINLTNHMYSYSTFTYITSMHTTDLLKSFDDQIPSNDCTSLEDYTNIPKNALEK